MKLIIFLTIISLFVFEKLTVLYSQDKSEYNFYVTEHSNYIDDFFSDLKKDEENFRYLKQNMGREYKWNSEYAGFLSKLDNYNKKYYRYNRKCAIIFYLVDSKNTNIWLVLPDYLNDDYFPGIGLTVNIGSNDLLDLERNIKLSIDPGLSNTFYKDNGRNFEIEIDTSSRTFLKNSSYYSDILLNALMPYDILDILYKYKVKDIIIIPNANISSMPFSMFKTGNDRYLVDEFTISIAPSIFSFDEYDSREDSLINFLIVGDPESGCSGMNFSRLPGAKKEADTIARLFNTEALTGLNATKENIMKVIEDADLIYFATHGAANTEDPMESYILVGGSNDCRLTIREVQNLNLRSDLAVLSACQTGLGGIYNAGIINIARAFYLAGANNVIMSLWDVNDNATENLMTIFMNNYHLKKLPPAIALQMAIIESRKNYPHPVYWASFTVFGLP